MGTLHSLGYEKGLSDDKWDELVNHIRRGKCTPFIGAGACSTLPKGAEIAQKLSEERGYPLDDKSNLQRVTQFIAIRNGAMGIKSHIAELIQSQAYPDFMSPTEPHSVLADLGLPIYITTNYDDFMEQALKKRNRNVKVDCTRWGWIDKINNKKIPSVFDEEYEPSTENPLVYHFHGKCEYPDSMVLTEDDYLDFLIEQSKKSKIIPPTITTSLSNSSLLFIGYSLNDLTLRMILRGLMKKITTQRGYHSIAVQIEPTLDSSSENDKLIACEYIDKYFDKSLKMEIDIYWGKAEDFVKELGIRWNKHCMEIKNEKQSN